MIHMCIYNIEFTCMCIYTVHTLYYMITKHHETITPNLHRYVHGNLPATERQLGREVTVQVAPRFPGSGSGGCQKKPRKT